MKTGFLKHTLAAATVALGAAALSTGPVKQAHAAHEAHSHPGLMQIHYRSDHWHRDRGAVRNHRHKHRYHRHHNRYGAYHNWRYRRHHHGWRHRHRAPVGVYVGPHGFSFRFGTY